MVCMVGREFIWGEGMVVAVSMVWLWWIYGGEDFVRSPEDLKHIEIKERKEERKVSQ